jgi:phytoene/squalene synthetase
MRTDYIPIRRLVYEGVEPASRQANGLASTITKAASKQTFYTIRFLADRQYIRNAYQAYAYFRWVDDCVDHSKSPRVERIAFLERQRALVNRCYRGESVFDLLPQEEMLASLIESDRRENSGLQTYIRKMMAVMAFDTYRRGCLISKQELNDYSLNLATAVTEALHYCIGHNDEAPRTEERYFAVTGAHITHMLRDTCEDIAAGYFNIPCEFLKFYKLDPCDTQSMAFRVWIRNRVQLARAYFAAGKDYLRKVKNRRCRLAGSAYIARFESFLNAIEDDGYHLRDQYVERKSIKGALDIASSALSLYFASVGRDES